MPKRPARTSKFPPPLNPKKTRKKMSENYDLILRSLGYAMDFLQMIIVPVLLLALTGRLAR